MQLQHYIPYLVMAIVVGVILWRGTRRMRVREGAMLLLPLLVSSLILAGLWFSPHPAATPLTLLALAVAALSGVAIGLWRAGLMRLSRDPDGSVWMQSSPAAVVLLLGLFAVRQLGRTLAGADGDPTHMTPAALIAFDAFLLFAVGMVLANRLTLWRRVRALRGEA